MRGLVLANPVSWDEEEIGRRYRWSGEIVVETGLSH